MPKTCNTGSAQYSQCITQISPARPAGWSYLAQPTGTILDVWIVGRDRHFNSINSVCEITMVTASWMIFKATTYRRLTAKELRCCVWHFFVPSWGIMRLHPEPPGAGSPMEEFLRVVKDIEAARAAGSRISPELVGAGRLALARLRRTERRNNEVGGRPRSPVPLPCDSAQRELQALEYRWGIKKFRSRQKTTEMFALVQ